MCSNSLYLYIYYEYNIMDNRVKKHYTSQNALLCRHQALKNLPINNCEKNYYNSEFNIIDPAGICDVHVGHMHSLLFAKSFIDSGFNPVIVSLVTNNFNTISCDRSEDIYDDLINIRTNLNANVVMSSNLFPINGPEIVYVPILHVIRDEMLNINMNKMYKTSLILSAPLLNPKLKKDSYKLDDYIITKESIEVLFQTAILRNHDVLILNDYGCKHTKSSIKDVVDIYNLCILKYGHYFKHIIFSVPISTQQSIDKAIYVYFENNIIRPQDLVSNEEISEINTKVFSINNQEPVQIEKEHDITKIQDPDVVLKLLSELTNSN
jgi:hypothetical protein